LSQAEIVAHEYPGQRQFVWLELKIFPNNFKKPPTHILPLVIDSKLTLLEVQAKGGLVSPVTRVTHSFCKASEAPNDVDIVCFWLTRYGQESSQQCLP
jgi:hypothetical protein